MDESVKGYWRILDPVWDLIDIYEGERVFLESYSKADPNAGLLYAAHFAQSEIGNGGFNQFFGNSTGILAPEAVAGMRRIGMSRIAAIMEKAMGLFGPDYPRDRSQRQTKLQGMDKAVLRGLDNEFFGLIRVEAGGFEDAADRFVDDLTR